jgi:hypothetical protein
VHLRPEQAATEELGTANGGACIDFFKAERLKGANYIREIAAIRLLFARFLNEGGPIDVEIHESVCFIQLLDPSQTLNAVLGLEHYDVIPDAKGTVGVLEARANQAMPSPHIEVNPDTSRPTEGYDGHAGFLLGGSKAA